jgi:nucleoid-associated protein YgaU
LRTLSDQQKKFLRIYDNLRYDAAHHVVSPQDPNNFAAQLFDDFMQNETFQEALETIAVDFGRMDILSEVDRYKSLPPLPPEDQLGFAEGLVTAVERNDDAMLVDLIDSPAQPTYSMAELNVFWNISANLQETNPELHTHLLADKRYMAMFDQTVAANEYAEDTIAPLRAEALSAHQRANNTLDTMEYDVMQMQYNADAKMVFERLESGDFSALGEKLTADAPQTIFSGLQVAQPLSEKELKQITKPYKDYYDSRQEAKNMEAEARAAAELEAANAPEAPAPTPEIDYLPEQSPLVRVFTSSAATLVPETDHLATQLDTIVIEVEPDPEPEAAEAEPYIVQSGDNLWKIAQSEYGLTSYKDIMRTVEHIAHKNGLENGVDANHIKPGDPLVMPTAEDIAGPAPTAEPAKPALDWEALDADTRRNQMAMTNGF